MIYRCLLALAVIALAAPTSILLAAEPSPVSAQHKKVPFKDLPSEIKEKILEKIKQSDKLPDELKQKLLDATEGKSDEATDEPEGAEEKTEEESDDQEEEKPQKPSKNERVNELRDQITEMETEFKFKVAQYKQELEEQRLAIEKTKLEREIEEDLNGDSTRKLKEKIEELKLQQSLLELESKLAAAKDAAVLREINAKKSAAEAQLATRDALQKLEDVVLDEQEYSDTPFKNGVLTISDRRIELNGPIMSGAAKYVADRIDYYNNESQKPIFLIIDSSPGGSGIEGLHILQAMRKSEAPVHVVVKEYAASMAAIITTLADHSYAYPNAIILHHQASSGTRGNTTMQKEQLDRVREMSARLVGEVADKIGITEEQFVAQMYNNRSTGDWDLFADQANKQGWVDHVVEEIRETAIRRRPTGARSMPLMFSFSQENPASQPAATIQPVDPALERYEVQLEEQLDEQGHRFVRLPRLSPLDHWFLYDGDDYYR